MRKLFYSALIIATISTISFNLKAQVYNGDLTLTNQAQVDGFNYTSVTGNLTLYGANSSISNLNGLSELQSIGGGFEITNTLLTKRCSKSNNGCGIKQLSRGAKYHEYRYAKIGDQ